MILLNPVDFLAVDSSSELVHSDNRDFYPSSCSMLAIWVEAELASEV